MPRLVLLNGPPASGKSTLARMFVDDHPLALDLDVDRVRDLLGGWRDHPERAGPLARAVVLAAARTHLAAGYDVVVPQFLGRVGFVEELADAAAAAGAEFVEIVLLPDRDDALRRFRERTGAAGRTEPAGGTPEPSAMYDRLLAVVAARPATKIVAVAGDRPAETYAALLAALR